MKGLVYLPQLKVLEQAYRKIQTAPESISESDLALWSQWTRFDPRLGEQWISTVIERWRSLSPLKLNEALRSQPWPAAAGPLFEQARVFWDWNREERRLFQSWCRLVMSGICPAQWEQYFIGLRAIAGEAMRRDAYAPLRTYTRWGYLGREVLLNKARVLKSRGLPRLRRFGAGCWMSFSKRARV